MWDVGTEAAQTEQPRGAVCNAEHLLRLFCNGECGLVGLELGDGLQLQRLVAWDPCALHSGFVGAAGGNPLLSSLLSFQVMCQDAIGEGGGSITGGGSRGGTEQLLLALSAL